MRLRVSLLFGETRSTVVQLSSILLSRQFSAGVEKLCGSVWSFGDNSNGALGLPSPLSDSYEPTQVPALPSNIASIAAGHYHSLAVTTEGEVYAWGRNEEGQLGRGFNSPRNGWSNPERVRGFKGIKIREVYASGVISSAIGEEGEVFVWGRSKRGQLGLGFEIIESKEPSRITSLIEHEIIKVSYGWGHALALTKEGKLFGWGFAEEGRLGQMESIFQSGPSISENIMKPSLDEVRRLIEEKIKREDNMPIIWEPSLVKELSEIRVSDVSCGLDHSLVLSNGGTILSGGDNTYGQLGRKTGNSIPDFLPIADISNDITPISLSSGLGHSLALCNYQTTPEPQTRVLSWGWNRSSQLGRKGGNEIPDFVEGLDEKLIVSVLAGRVHSICLSKEGEVWAWGSGRNGRLGLGHSMDEMEPALVESLEGFRVLQAVCGFDHNLVLVAE